jgi:hypothetical protein
MMASKSRKSVRCSISVVTLLDLWLKRRTETVDFQAKPNLPPGHNHQITDWDKFREFAQANGDKTQEEMAELWPGDISARTSSRALDKIGFTRKKNFWLSRKK